MCYRTEGSVSKNCILSSLHIYCLMIRSKMLQIQLQVKNMTMHSQKWENERVMLLISVLSNRFRECLCTARESRFLSLTGVFNLLSCHTYKLSVKLLAKYIFYQFLATSSAKMHE